MEGSGQFGSKANKQYGCAAAERPPSPAPDSAALSAHQIGHTRGDGPQPDWFQLECGLRKQGYKDLTVLGKGGFGRAYKATNSKSETHFVIKVSLSQQGAELLEEYRLMNALAHPNLPSVYNYLIIEDLPIVVMDFCAGGDLHVKLSKQSMSAVQIAYMMHDLLQALVHLHSRAVIHRDVKLANIFFDHGQKALLGDLGIAIFIDRKGTADRLGTPGWMAPEYCDTTRAYGTKIDVWASSQVLACAFERKFDPDGLGLTSEGISPWMQELYQHTSDHNAISRWPSTKACTMMTIVRKMEEHEMVLDMRSLLRSDPSFSSSVSSMLRAGGCDEIVDKGRKALKRIKAARQENGESSKEDKIVRNRYRKARRRAQKALRKLPDPNVCVKAEPV